MCIEFLTTSAFEEEIGIRIKSNRPASLRHLLGAALLLVFAGAPVHLHAQQVESSLVAELPDAPSAVLAGQTQQEAPSASTATASPQTPDGEGKQTKRILFVIPNFRSVSADVKLPPQSSKEKFKLMFEDSFDYSAFVYVGILAGVADAQKSYPEFGHGGIAYGRYYWHQFADNLDGNLMTEAVLPSVLHEDPRYYTLGRGGIVRRSIYSVGRLAITRSDLTATNAAHNTFNFSEIVGNGASAGISGLYYPSHDRTWTKTGQKWIVQIALDGFSNLVKEFWPDVNDRILHNKD